MKVNKIFIFTIIYIFVSIILFAKSGNILIDFQREAYIPYQMLNGKTLIKDIFLIYGFWGYFFNFILYKVNLNINMLYFESIILSYLLALLFYFISKKFLNSDKSFLLTILFLLTSVYSCSNFGFAIPYSFSTIWAILAIFYVFLLLLENKNSKFIYFIIGFISLCRIEFFLLTLFFVILFQIYKKEFKIKNLCFSVILPIFWFFYIILNHITVGDCIKNITYISLMLKTDSIRYLYRGMGAYFLLPYFILYLKRFVYIALVYLLSFLIYKKNKIFSYLFTIILLVFIPNFATVTNLIIFPNILLVIYLIYKKNITRNELILFILSFILSSKSIFALNILNYSNFGVILSILFLYLALSKTIDRKYLFNNIIIFLIILSLTNLGTIFNEFKIPIKTSIGTFYSDFYNMQRINEVNDYILKNVKKDEKVIVYPEGQIINLINKKNWDFYNSTFTPLDFETFGDDFIINQIKNNKIDYLIYLPRNTMDYSKGEICKAWAVDFCSYISNNYSEVANFSDDIDVAVYKKNKYEK